MAILSVLSVSGLFVSIFGCFCTFRDANNTQNDLTLTCKIPEYDANTYQSTNIVIRNINNNVTTLKKGKFYLVYFLPIASLNQVSTIDSSKFDSLNGKIFNSNVSISYDALNINSQFNLIVFYSGSNDGTITSRNGTSFTLEKNNFYLIKNKNSNNIWVNTAPLKIDQYKISEIN